MIANSIASEVRQQQGADTEEVEALAASKPLPRTPVTASASKPTPPPTRLQSAWKLARSKIERPAENSILAGEVLGVADADAVGGEAGSEAEAEAERSLLDRMNVTLDNIKDLTDVDGDDKADRTMRAARAIIHRSGSIDIASSGGGGEGGGGGGGGGLNVLDRIDQSLDHIKGLMEEEEEEEEQGRREEGRAGARGEGRTREEEREEAPRQSSVVRTRIHRSGSIEIDNIGGGVALSRALDDDEGEPLIPRRAYSGPAAAASRVAASVAAAGNAAMSAGAGRTRPLFTAAPGASATARRSEVESGQRLAPPPAPLPRPPRPSPGHEAGARAIGGAYTSLLDQYIVKGDLLR